MNHGAAFAEVSALLAEYFDGLHFRDTRRLARVFHPEARYFCVKEGALLHWDMSRYFPVVDRRPSPASQGHARTDRVLSIEFAGPETALAKVACSIPPRRFIDLLSLVRLEGRWCIVSKVFHQEVRDGPGER